MLPSDSRRADTDRAYVDDVDMPARGVPNAEAPWSDQYAVGPDASWEAPVLRKMFQFVEMKPDWDAYGAPRVRRDAAFFAFIILKEVMQPGTPLPQIVPSSVGGIQLEWHERGIDLELHVVAPYECELWFQDHLAGDEPITEDITNDLTAINRAVALLTVRRPAQGTDVLH